MAEKPYFGKEDITPDFLKAKKSENAKSELKNLEETAEKDNPEENSVSSAKEFENDFSYTGSGKTIADRIRENKKKLNRAARIKKQAPLLLIAGLIVAALAFMFFSIGTLGNQIETLITRATDTMFGSYSENTLGITEELLEGSRT